MRTVYIDPKLCANCLSCRVQEECSKYAVIREEPSDKPWIDSYKCSGCGDCAGMCEYHAAVVEG